ncbi:MAG: hypothetical protein GY841_08050 [FCB group bacterium]|nr:hypothetical protein [FCB group bacterium]
MWPKTLILVLVAFLALGIGTPAWAGSGPNLGEPVGDVDPWGGDNQNDDGDGIDDPGDGVVINNGGVPIIFISITIERTWLYLSDIIRKPFWEKSTPTYIEQNIETEIIKRTPIYINKGTGIR